MPKGFWLKNAQKFIWRTHVQPLNLPLLLEFFFNIINCLCLKEMAAFWIRFLKLDFCEAHPYDSFSTLILLRDSFLTHMVHSFVLNTYKLFFWLWGMFQTANRITWLCVQAHLMRCFVQIDPRLEILYRKCWQISWQKSFKSVQRKQRGFLKTKYLLRSKLTRIKDGMHGN